MSGTLWKAAGAATLVATVGLWWGADADRDVDTALLEGPAVQEPTVEVAAPTVEELDPEAQRRELAAIEAPEQERVEAAESAPAVAWIRGRVEDGEGAPLVGAELLLSRRAAYWLNVETDWGLTARSTSDGTFVLELTEADLAGLGEELVHDNMYMQLSAGLFRDREFWSVDDGAGGDVVAPVPGADIDLGTLELPEVGVIRGRIADSAGDPMGILFVGAGRDDDEDAGLDRVNPDGTFVVRELRGGTYRVVAAGPTTQHVVLAEAVEVRVGEATELPPATLVPGFPVSGRIVDPDGLPVAGAKISVPCHALIRTILWYGSDAATADEDGRFEIRAPLQGDVHVNISAEGYEDLTYDDPAGHLSTEEERVITLRPRRALLKFRVVDRDTGEPVEDYRLVLIREATRVTRLAPGEGESPEDGPHADGVSLRRALHEDRVIVQSEGYMDYNDQIYWSGDPNRVFELRLDRERGVRGRILVDGEPRAGVEVVLRDGMASVWKSRIVAGRVEELPERRSKVFPVFVGGYSIPDRVEGLDGETPPWTRALGRGARRLDAVRTDAEGRFAFEIPAPGCHQLDITVEGRPMHRVPSLWFAPGDNDLGDIRVGASGSIRGRLYSPDLQDLSCAEVLLLPGDQRVRAGADGTFAFEDLPAGPYWLELSGAEEDRDGLFDAAPDFYLTLGEGQIRSVTLNLDGRLSSEFEPLVRLNGRTPGPYSQLRFVSPAGELFRSEVRLSKKGSAYVSWVQAHGDVFVHLEMGRRTETRGHVFERIGGPGVPWLLTLGGPADAEFDFIAERVSMTVHAPAFEVDDDATELELVREGETLLRQPELRAADGVLRADLGWLHPGSYTATLRVDGRSVGEGAFDVVSGQDAELVID